MEREYEYDELRNLKKKQLLNIMGYKNLNEFIKVCGRVSHFSRKDLIDCILNKEFIKTSNKG